MSESNVYRRRIMRYKDGPCAERVEHCKYSSLCHFLLIWLSIGLVQESEILQSSDPSKQ